MIEIYLGGYLAFYMRNNKTRFTYSLDQPIQLEDVLTKLGIPMAEVGIAIVNDEPVDIPLSWVKPGDRIVFYSQIGGG
jgi:hypothetical protein